MRVVVRYLGAGAVVERLPAVSRFDDIVDGGCDTVFLKVDEQCCAVRDMPYVSLVAEAATWSAAKRDPASERQPMP